MSQVTRHALRGLLVAAAAVSAAAPVANALPLAPPPTRDEDRPTERPTEGPADRRADHLTVTVRHAGPGRDGTYQLYCHPGSGDHPDVAGACGALDRGTRWGRETFAPVPGGSVCTMQYGGPATAHVTGTWAGRPVDASYDRSDGCEIGRWDRLVPLLPDLSPRGQS
ncbi:SSI family serine proteinase inhibitor [Streptomyces sp. NPDC005648]|uniref:SSI family serine proteinase inhibitor n=1 Tax=Streptomyces sp. NPDC005648 TaxID=3157044 RepID=UPI0033BC6D5B